jgi:hypothetical protein
MAIFMVKRHILAGFDRVCSASSVDIRMEKRKKGLIFGVGMKKNCGQQQ